MQKQIALAILTGLTLCQLANAGTPKNVLVVAQSIDDLASLDPAEGFEFSSVQSFNSLYQRLVQSNRSNPANIEAALASHWVAGKDGQSLQFTLKPGARFASGNPVRPEDVIFSLSRAVKLNKSPAFILNELGWKAENVDGFLKKTGNNQVELSWPAKVGPSFALSILSAPIASIVDAKTVQANEQNGDAGNGWLKSHSAGSGSFQLREYKPHEALVLDANPRSPAGAPLLKTVIFKNVPDAAARRLQLEQGDADIARDLSADQIAALSGKTGVKVQVFPSAALYYVAFNTVSPSNSSLKNPAVWEAARWLIDYDGVANKLLRGQFKVHQSFLPSGFLGALKDQPYRFDPARAKAILAKAGIKDLTIKLDTFNQPPYADIAQSLQASFAQAGIRLELQPAIGSQVYAKVRARSHEGVLLSWTPDYFDPHSNASAFAINRDDGTKTLAWRNGWVIPALSDKTDQAVQETRPAKRVALYSALQKDIQKNSPFVLAFQASQQVVLRSNVQGFLQGLNADQVYFDKVSK
ncbi:ABC transporter substrate-binding protein [Aquitalea sp. ASV11]|uniref:ABC transporter substrate-binding protein n=1 Tax=Aquitalea sp. ASV11 TaxID=2795103 RepID=UPI0018ED9D79|nr:ABC transporter substrate-binding protein [Aquitalea sp. ASV11]